jgi:hypothetical protein
MLIVILNIALVIFIVYNMLKIAKSKKKAGKGLFDL